MGHFPLYVFQINKDKIFIYKEVARAHVYEQFHHHLK